MKTMKKLFSMLMVMAMVLSMMTGMALAEEGSTATKAFSYVAADGTSFDVTEEAILSCNKTANENYLLSEVLAAAGATLEADCCYKVEAADGYTVYLDAAYSDSLALYNNGGWRTTFDTVPEGIVGGWYKVSGFTTITAVGHSYTDGKCTNEINTSKAEKKVCGAVANAFTYVAADGTFVAVTEEAILSCNKTANENYLLSEVLAAAGATMEAECCYKVEAADGYTVYLDADNADALALYYNGGWRTTFDTVPEGIVGGWYKVSGFTTITAVNHSYAGGKCVNNINTSKAEKKVCGAVNNVFNYVAADGTSVTVSEEMILSCNKTANENYLLSDVLAAAGASMEAECCYKVEAADGYTVWLDADNADALALYYNGGWRTTFDTVPEGIVGGWYKVSGFTTITAVNHSYTDGKCTNNLNMSKAEKKVCEAEEPVTTVALTDCKVTLSSTTLTYNGSYRYPKVTVTLPDGTVAVKGTDYTLASKNNKYAGTATITVTAVEGSSLLTGETSAKFTIKKAAQKITVKVTSKTLKYSTLKNRSVTFSIYASSKNSRSYSMVSRTSTKLSVSKTTGKITVKKGTKKGTYKIKVKITAKSSGSYLSASLTKTITVKVQ